MIRRMVFNIAMAAALFPVFAEDEAGCKDHPLFNRMPHTSISECSSNYGQAELYMEDGATVTKEGTKTVLRYDYSNESESTTAPSFFQIVKNYENAVTKKGGKKVYYYDDDEATLFVNSSGKDVWIDIVCAKRIGGDEGSYQLTILEIENMKQDIEANTILDSLNKNGYIALYINFETGKSVIKKESESIVNEIVSLLKSNPDLKVSIEGHTDDVGKPEANMKLSNDRASAVVNAVISGGIDKARLSSKGWGQTMPVDSNKTEEGRAKNRRVEIVKVK